MGDEIVSYLANRINECLSKAEYALLSYIEYASRGELPEDRERLTAGLERLIAETDEEDLRAYRVSLKHL